MVLNAVAWDCLWELQRFNIFYDRPLDLCDTTSSSPDVHLLGYSGSHGGGLSVSNHQGSLSSSSFVNNAVQVTSAMVLSNGFAPSSAALSPSSRYFTDIEAYLALPLHSKTI